MLCAGLYRPAAINDWGNLYMTETLDVGLVTANSAVTMFELGGFIGALVAGWGSDKLFNGNREPMNLIFCRGYFAFGWLPVADAVPHLCDAGRLLFYHRLFCLWPTNADWYGSGRMLHKDAAGAATGFVGLFAYLGASLAGWPLAWVINIWSWNGFFVVISIAAGISALFLLPLLNAQAPRSSR